ncbi:MAG: aminotransferase class I/II-fold pyridoxal phosphate-dependent enzyme, partial [Kiritimatiellae bacterium]|nr:aminotransferase class I/II-fold pyridoxal phosphate-dependent enzyme [Kiritimatiellia bacterium]
RTLSKSYALAGIRFGYAVGNSELIGALYKLKDSYNLNLLTQKAAAAALRDQAWMKNLVERIRATREAFVGELVRLGFSTFPSETNFVWTRPPEHLSAPDLYQALKRQDILIRHFSPPGLREHVRITIGTDEQMATLARALQNLCA